MTVMKTICPWSFVFCVFARAASLPLSFPQDELGIRIVNGREAESIGAQPGDSDSEEETPGQHKFRPRGPKTSQSLDPWKKILQSKKVVIFFFCIMAIVIFLPCSYVYEFVEEQGINH